MIHILLKKYQFYAYEFCLLAEINFEYFYDKTRIDVSNICQNSNVLVRKMIFMHRILSSYLLRVSPAFKCKNLACYKKQKTNKNTFPLWRCRGLNPGPFTCKANALPLRYIPYMILEGFKVQ